jgi:hypothetical protein
MSIIRRIIVGFTLLITLVTLTAWWSMPDPKSHHTEVAQVPPPTHVEWDDYPVGGALLCSPARDSLGRYPCITIPPGSVLSVPRLVEGDGPNQKRVKS